MPNDKDQRFSLVKKSDLPVLSSQILDSARYVVISPHDLPEAMRKTYRSLCTSVGKRVDEDWLSGAMFRSALSAEATSRSRLQLLIKTHKEQGMVVPRPVHASPHYMFSRWHFAKADLKGFYLCGAADEISTAVLRLWIPADPMRDILKRVMVFLLDN